MLKKILVALDGSENAEHALPWVKRYAAPERAQVVLFRAVNPEHLDRESIPSETQDARNYLQRIESELNYAGIPAKVVVQVGPPAASIVQAAQAEGGELILMTTRGGSPVQRWALGGVTERVLRLSRIPVLPVRSQTALPKQGRVRRIVVPLDGSKLAEESLPWLRKFARFFKSRVVFLHVYPMGAGGLKSSHQATYDALHKRITRAVERLGDAGVKAVFRLQRGDPAERILAFVDQNDLILTTTHGLGGVKRLIFGSVAEKLVQNSPVPVLVYRSAESGALAKTEAS
jgi:nucleotide-binding universal stress UspA family protein